MYFRREFKSSFPVLRFPDEPISDISHLIYCHVIFTYILIWLFELALTRSGPRDEVISQIITVSFEVLLGGAWWERETWLSQEGPPGAWDSREERTLVRHSWSPRSVGAGRRVMSLRYGTSCGLKHCVCCFGTALVVHVARARSLSCGDVSAWCGLAQWMCL